MVHVGHAAARTVVRLPDGRTGRLVSVPGPQSRKGGNKARVLLPSGRYLSVDPETLEVQS